MKQALFYLLLTFTYLLPVTGICQAPDLIIKDVNIISMVDHTIQNKKSVAVTNGIISDINDFKKIKKGKNTQVINGKNKFMMPGLAEMHSHLPAPEKIDTYLIANVAAGVTRLRAMNSEAPVLDMKELISRKSISPHIYYPLIVTEESLSKAQYVLDKTVKNAKSDGYDFIKLFGIYSEQMFDWLIASANANNIIVCGHYPKMVYLNKVITSGFKSIEHLGGYSKIKDSTELDAIIRLTKQMGTYNCPTLDWDYVAADLMLFEDYKKRLVFDNAPQHLIDGWNKELENYISKEGKDKLTKGKESYLPTFNYKMKILKKLNDNGNLLLLGSDPGGLYQMHGFNLYEEMVHWSNAGISNYDILRAGTVNPAKFFGEENQWGTIEVGKAADFLLLDKNPLEDIRNMKTTEMTIIGGKVHSKKDLLNKI